MKPDYLVIHLKGHLEMSSFISISTGCCCRSAGLRSCGVNIMSIGQELFAGQVADPQERDRYQSYGDVSEVRRTGYDNDGSGLHVRDVVLHSEDFLDERPRLVMSRSLSRLLRIGFEVVLAGDQLESWWSLNTLSLVQSGRSRISRTCTFCSSSAFTFSIIVELLFLILMASAESASPVK